MPTTIAPETVLPPADPSELEPLNAVLPKLPSEVRRGLAAFIDALSRGEAVRLEPVSTVLTTGQAADILNISRMTLVKLLDEGRIPYQQPSVHRMVLLADVLAYKEERSTARAAFLADTINQADDDGLLFDDIDRYTAALKRARNRQRP